MRKKLTLVNLKVGVGEKRRLIAQARKYTGGNVSAWIRLAAMQFSPKMVKTK